MITAESDLVFAPRGWPVVERGLLMTYLGRVVIVRVERNIDEQAMERFLVEWPRGIDCRPPHARAAALYDIPTWADATAARRSRFAKLFASRKEILRRTTKAWALCTASPLVRGMVQAIYWMSPPPYPHTVVASPVEAFRFIHRHLEEVDPERYAAEYQRLLTLHASTLRG